MSIASNLYASRVFSEHPIDSWPLDDDISYISLISESQRSFDLWTLTNATYNDYLPYPDNPFGDAQFPFSTFSELIAVNPSLDVEALSPVLFNLQDLNQSMNTFAINFYAYTDGSVESYEYGYRYLDPFTSNYVEDTVTVTDSRFATWIRMGATFNPPNVNADAKIIIRIKFSSPTSASVVFNGMSVAQWSENTSNTSLGVTPALVSAEVQSMLGAVNGVQVEAYGVSEKDGYILEENNRLLAINHGVPMVYGSDNITRLNPSATLPSIIVPGCGFLNESGRYNSYTFEMWLRIENNSADDRRIWGPVSSDYGLYVSRGYLTLLIGNSFGSYFVADWYRPMILHVTLREDSASVLINGEEVISITFNTSELTLPPITEDWIGFYCHNDMPIYEVDCVSIFPYIVPSAVAKKRFVWGQGVESPDDINSAYEGTVAYVDFPYSQYTANQLYPDLSYWDSGYFENLSATRRSISLPDYKLPEISLSEKTLQQLYDDNYLIQETNHARFMSFRPNATWENPAYYLFPNINVLTDVVRGVWGVFEIDANIASSRPLMVFQQINNPTTRIEITVNGLNIYYRLYENDILYPTEFSFPISLDSHFVVGFHLPRLFDTYGNIIGEFFGDPSGIQLYIGGNGTDTFEGKVYRIGFSNQTNLNEIENHFNSDGIADPSDGDLLNDHLGSYTLLPITKFNRMFLDIGVSSYWEEYFPLSIFAGYSVDQYGKTNYGVDFLQYNIGYPTVASVIETPVTGSWSYEELKNSYSSPIVRTYEVLDNFLITGYDSYIDLENNATEVETYDFSGSSVRTYLTFQRISSGANRPLSEYVISETINSSNALDVTQYADQFSTKFEIKDHSLIYPPTRFDVNDTAMVVHLDINVHGIRSNPLNVRKMSISSKTLGDNIFYEIGTRLGTKIYPYSKVGIYFDNKKNNPYLVNKESEPYLYLTKNSGIESLGLREFNVERGLSVPINKQQATNQKVSAIQIWMKYTPTQFPVTPVTLFSIDGASVDIGFNLISDQSGSRGKIYAVDLNNGTDYTGLTFFQDGTQVMMPYIEKNKWTVIGINFAKPIDFSNYTGAINLFQSAVFNNIAFYRSSALQQAQSAIYRKWSNIAGTISVPLDWQYWKMFETPNGSWDSVLKLAETGLYGVNPSEIFKSYSGTNREIVDDNEGLIVSQSGTLIFASEIVDVVDTTPTTTTRILVTNEPEWSSYIKKPV